MRSSLAVFGKTALLTALVTLMALPSFAQVGLRNAFDSDNDDKADYFIFRPANNTWYVLGSTGSIYAQEWGVANEDWMVPGDYDGDGQADIAVWRETTGTWYVITSSTGTFTAQSWGITGDEPIARDYDGDGRTDLAVVRRTGGNMIWYMVYSSTGNFDARQFGISTDFTAPGDYDGDGKYDVAVQRPGASPTDLATFYIESAAGFEAHLFGLSNDLVVPGDYDGDGKTDIAVVREGAMPEDQLTWYWRRSTDGGLGGGFTWGVTGTDLLAQNDYNGDGITDPAVWRNTNGTFYVRNPNGSYTAVSWGQPNDFPISSYDTH